MRRACLLLALLSLGAPAGEALAQDAACQALLSQLATFDREHTQTRSLEARIADQRRRSDDAARAAREAGCDADPDAAPACDALLLDAGEQQKSLDDLEQRLGGETEADAPAQRRRLVAMIEDHRCAGAMPPLRRAELGVPDTDFVQPSGDDDLTAAPPAVADDLVSPGAVDIRTAGAPLRTLCVRTCDGGFFPISFAVSAAQLPKDADQCRRLCPNMDVALYVHDAYRQTVDDAVSAATGEPLRAMPNAFRFRTVYDPACTCRPAEPPAAVAQSTRQHVGKLDRLDTDGLSLRLR